MITTQKITKVPFVDLSAQYQAIKEEVDSAIAGVLKSTAFITVVQT